jgi:ATP-dependent Clp protease ATP-binding subunit ClpC
LAEAAKRLEAHQSVRVQDDAIAAAVELTQRFEPYRALPGKGVRLLEESVQEMMAQGDTHLGRESVAATFARRTGLPRFLLSDDIPMRIEEARAFFDVRSTRTT